MTMLMPRQMRMMIAAATLSTAAAVCAAQTANQSGPGNMNEMQVQAAPIEHAYPNQNSYQAPAGQPSIAQESIAPGQDLSANAGEAQATPIQGVILRVGPKSNVEEVSSEPGKLELRVERGIANVNVHKPAKGTLILVDLPGGQTQLLKNGLYTFNAETNTARVLKGEALAFPAGATPDAKPMKVKEYNKVVYNGPDVKPHEFVPYEAQVDMLPGPQVSGEQDSGEVARGYGYGPYGDGFYAPYPYYAYSPWGWGYPYYPYGYGFYPSVGFGFGYYGGFHRGYHGGDHDRDHDGGFRGGDHDGGFHGGAAHGRGR